MQLGLGELIRVGARAVSKYTGTVLAVFVVQSLVAFGCLIATAFAFSQAFARQPMFDDAVRGDLIALIYSLRFGKGAFFTALALVVGALVTWQLIAWFVAGGLYGVIAQRPEGRGDTARCFGASAASTYLTYARLTLCSLAGYLVVLIAWLTGLTVVADQLKSALTMSQLVVPLALASLPAVLLLHFFWTVTDYARIELTVRQDSHDPGVIATYLRTIGFVITRPLTLVHAGAGWIAIALVTIAYVYLSHGHPMYGADGAFMLLFVRLCVSLVRMALRIAVMAGQVELAGTRALPPRRAEPAIAIGS